VTPLLLFLLAATPARSAVIVIRPTAGETFTAVVTGPVNGTPRGDFGGTISLNGSTATMAASGKTELAQGALRLLLTLRWADVPEDWVNRFRPDGFDYRVHGRIGGREEIDWSGSLKWEEVPVEAGRETGERYLRLESMDLANFSLLQSEARALVKVRNPFSFPIKLSGAEYTLSADGREVGSGRLPGTLLRAAQDNQLMLPVEIEHGQLLAAAGDALRSGGEIDGKLTGKLLVKTPGGDIAVPLDLSGRLSLTSE
jgi:LEA14-like dessication related protein